MWRQLRPPRTLHRLRDALRNRLASTARAGGERHAEAPARRCDVLGAGAPLHRMSPVRDYAAELDGYAYLPRMFDKARAKLAGDSDAPAFGCPLDHSCMARLRVYPEDVLDLVTRNGGDDDAILAGLRDHAIPSAEATWFDARATEDELLTGVYLKVRPREQLDELKPRPGHKVLAIVEGEARISLGERQMRIVRAGEVVRIPPELPHAIKSTGDVPLRLETIPGCCPSLRSRSPTTSTRSTWPGSRTRSRSTR